MVTTHTIPEPLTGDAELDAEIANFEKRGNWVEDRKEILKGLTVADFAEEIMRLQAEHPERLMTGEQIRAMAEQKARALTAAHRHAELVGA